MALLSTLLWLLFAEGFFSCILARPDLDNNAEFEKSFFFLV